MPKIPLRALAALLALASGLLAPTAEAQRVRVIVLSFEGAGADDARAAAVRGLETTYEMVDEQAAIDAAGEIGVDVSTPEGMSSVVAHLGIELVIGGFVEGRGRRATTTIWVSDIQGNEMSRRVTGPPTGRGAADLIANAAYEAAAEALIALHPPEPFEETPIEETPIEEEPVIVDEEVHVDTGDNDLPWRWVQPLIRGLVGIDLRNRTAAAAPMNDVDRFDAAFFPMIEIALDAHPLSFLPGPENGLYLSVRTGFSAGLTYSSVLEDGLPMNVYHLDVDAGYAGIIADLFELGGTLGLGLDGVGLETPLPYSPGDYPSVEYFYFRPGLFGRIRAFQDYLIVAFGIGGRVLLGAGQINNFDDVPITRPPTSGPDHVYWGVANGGGVDFNIGLEGIIDPGFSYAARFGYTGHFVGFSDDAFGTAERTGATDEAWHILLQIGWAFVPPSGPAPATYRAPPAEEEAPPPRRDAHHDDSGPPSDLDEFDHLDDERPPGYR